MRDLRSHFHVGICPPHSRRCGARGKLLQQEKELTVVSAMQVPLRCAVRAAQPPGRHQRRAADCSSPETTTMPNTPGRELLDLIGTAAGAADSGPVLGAGFAGMVAAIVVFRPY